MNDINWDEIKRDFIAGWKCWVTWGLLDSSTCMEDTDNGPVRRSFEFRDGYEAAAKANDDGGDRPTCGDAEEYADAYLSNKKTDLAADFAAYAD